MNKTIGNLNLLVESGKQYFGIRFSNLKTDCKPEYDVFLSYEQCLELYRLLHDVIPTFDPSKYD